MQPKAVLDSIRCSRVADALGGQILRGGLVLIVGAQGTGKSTLAAELAARVSEHWASPQAGDLRVPGCPIYWLDGDQVAASIVLPGIRGLFAEAGVDHWYEERVKLIPEALEIDGFADVMRAAVPDDARILVVDSFEAWRAGLVGPLREHGGWLKVLVADAGAPGLEEAVGAADAVVIATGRRERPVALAKSQWRRTQPAVTWDRPSGAVERTMADIRFRTQRLLAHLAAGNGGL
jgi:energy-coupling factor transporter ATP-binding protein EcfA2